MTHLWLAGQEIAVRCAGETEELLSFTWAGRVQNIARICNHWSVHMDWWLEDEVRRDYYKVQTEDGLLCILYHDVRRESWHLARVYD